MRTAGCRLRGFCLFGLSSAVSRSSESVFRLSQECSQKAETDFRGISARKVGAIIKNIAPISLSLTLDFFFPYRSSPDLLSKISQIDRLGFKKVVSLAY